MFERRFLRGPVGLELVRPGVSGETGANEDEVLDELGTGDRELERDAAAE